MVLWVLFSVTFPAGECFCAMIQGGEALWIYVGLYQNSVLFMSSSPLRCQENWRWMQCVSVCQECLIILHNMCVWGRERRGRRCTCAAYFIIPFMITKMATIKTRTLTFDVWYFPIMLAGGKSYHFIFKKITGDDSCRPKVKEKVGYENRIATMRPVSFYTTEHHVT